MLPIHHPPRLPIHDSPNQASASYPAFFKPLGWRTGILLVLSGLGCLAMANGLIATAAQIPLLGEGPTVVSELQRLDEVRAWNSNASLALMGPVGLAYFFWLHGALENQEAIASPPLRWSPAGTIGRLFIPFYNIYVFYRTFQDLWRGGKWRRQAGEHGDSPLIGLYILLVLGLSVSNTLVKHEFESFNQALRRPSLDALRTAFRHLVAVQAGWLACILLFVLLIVGITIRQNRAAAQRRQGRADAEAR